jgi:hypothetical protein
MHIDAFLIQLVLKDLQFCTFIKTTACGLFKKFVSAANFKPSNSIKT